MKKKQKEDSKRWNGKDNETMLEWCVDCVCVSVQV